MYFPPLETQTHRLARQIYLNPKDRAARQRYSQMPAEFRELHPIPTRETTTPITGKFAAETKQTAKAMGW